MSQPNDLAIDSRDVVYASDPDWKNGTGRIWRITPDGAITLAASLPGTTNGIEVSPDERTLYVGDSRHTNVLAFDLSPSGELGNQRVLISLPANSLDGMRCDTAGNLYVTRKRSTGGAIAIVSPAGELLREVKLTGKSPSNIAFGGPDGRTCYVTMQDNGSIETFRTDIPGLSWKRFQDSQTSISAGPAAPKAFILSGNYPNPFNPSTVIEYTLRANSRVELTVYNAVGQEVAVLKREMESAGKHAVTWNAKGLPSGIYFARLKADGVMEVRKMMLMK
jgi:DNA-binding beta-propeller fold protein YncE